MWPVLIVLLNSIIQRDTIYPDYWRPPGRMLWRILGKGKAPGQRWSVLQYKESVDSSSHDFAKSAGWRQARPLAARSTNTRKGANMDASLMALFQSYHLIATKYTQRCVYLSVYITPTSFWVFLSWDTLSEKSRVECPLFSRTFLRYPIRELIAMGSGSFHVSFLIYSSFFLPVCSSKRNRTYNSNHLLYKSP